MTERVFELRTYRAVPGRLEDVKQRFRDHTLGLFARHGLEVVGFFSPVEGAAAEDTLVYLLASDSRTAADSAWAAFQGDSDWVRARDASVANGPIVDNIESTFLTATDFSPLH